MPPPDTPGDPAIPSAADLDPWAQVGDRLCDDLPATLVCDAERLAGRIALRQVGLLTIHAFAPRQRGTTHDVAVDRVIDPAAGAPDSIGGSCFLDCPEHDVPVPDPANPHADPCSGLLAVVLAARDVPAEDDTDMWA